MPENGIDLTRPIIQNQGGTFSTERTITIESGGKQYLIPTIVNGQQLSEDDAIRAWERGGNPEVGVFNTPGEAEAAAQARSQRIGELRGPEAQVAATSTPIGAALGVQQVADLGGPRQPVTAAPAGIQEEPAVGGMLTEIADLSQRRARAAAPTLVPWSRIEEQPGFQNLSASGKRQIRSQWLNEAEKLGTALYKKDKERGQFMEGVLGALPDYKDPQRTMGDWLNDFNLAIQTGVGGVTGGLGEAALGVGELLGMTDASRQYAGDPTSLPNLFNPAAQDANAKRWETEKSLAHQDFVKFKAEKEAEARAAGEGELGAGVAVGRAYLSRPSEAMLMLAEQVPIIASFVGPAGYARTLAAVPKLERVVEALRAGKMTEKMAAEAVVAAEKAGTRAAYLTSGTMGAALESADAKQTFIDHLTQMPDSVWDADPEYLAAVAGGEDKKAAKERLARDRSGWATGLGALLGIVDGMTGFERLFVGPMTGGIKARLVNAASEPFMETIQGINPLAVGNLQAQKYDPKIAFNQGFGPAIAEALVVAVPLGGVTALGHGGAVAGEGGAQAAGPVVEPTQPGPPGGAPAAPAAPQAEMPSAIGQAQGALVSARNDVSDAQRVIDDENSTPSQVSEAQQKLADAHSRANGLELFIQKWENVPVTKEVQGNIDRDERRIRQLEADTQADPDAKAREIGALQGRIEANRALQAVSTLDENQLQAYIDSRNQSLAASSAERGLGISVDRARLTNEIAHAQRLLEERAEIETPADIAFAQRAPTVFDRDAGGVPIWPDTEEVHGKPFMESINLQRDKALSLINLVRGNPQFTRSQRTTAITRARAAWEAANRVAAAWTLPTEELAARRAELVQTLGSGMTGATGLNPGHFAELAGVIAAEAERAGNAMTYRQAVLEAQRQIAAIYAPPTIIGPGSIGSQPDNPAGDTSKTYFYDDKPTVSGGRTLARTPTEEEKKLWNNTITALVKLGFNRTALDALGLRIATSEYALGLYLPSGNDKVAPNVSYTLAVSWAKHTQNDAKGRQWTAIHEIHHALADSARNGTDLSAVDPRFGPNGEFRTELEAAYKNGNGPLSRLDYPLNKAWGYGDSAIAAELWAQAGAYYFLDKNLLKQHAPKTFAFVEAFHANLARTQFTTRPGVAAAVQAGFSGVPPAPGVPVGQPPGGPAGQPGAGPVAGPAGPAPPPAGPAVAGPGGVGPSPLLGAAQSAVAATAARATSMLSPQRAVEAQGRLAADAIATVEAQLAQERTAESAGGEGARPVEPARRPQGVPRAAPESAVAAAAGAGEAAQAAAAPAARPVRPPARAGGRNEGRPEAAQGAVARAEKPRKLTAGEVKVGDTVSDEFGDRVVVTGVGKDGTITVRGSEGFEYETTPTTINLLAPQTPPTGVKPSTTQTKYQQGLADRSVALEDARAAIEENIAGYRERLRNPEPGEGVRERVQLRTAIKIEQETLADLEAQSIVAETALAAANWVRQKVGATPSTKERFLKVLGNVFGILPSEVQAKLPKVEIVTTDDIDPNTNIVRLADGKGVRISGSQVAFYLPSDNRLVIFADNLPAGQELQAILHELFHKRGHQFLGRALMKSLRREAEGWRNAPEGSIERKIYNDAMPRVVAASEDGETPAEKKAIYDEELLPYFITSAVKLGVMPNQKSTLKKGAEGWLSRVWTAFRAALSKVLGTQYPANKFTAQELMAAAWGAAQLEKGATAYEIIAAGGRVNPPRTAEQRAASFVSMFPRFAQRAEEIRRRRNLSGPETFAPEERVMGGSMMSMEERRSAALSAAPKNQVVQAATASPPVGPVEPQYSIVERFAPTEAKPIHTRDELSEYLRTGNRPTVNWMQQARDRAVENYIDHQRPFLAWLKRHGLAMKAWAELKLIPGRLKERAEVYRRELLAPLERGVAKLAKNANVPFERAALDAGWWATLRHIPEANAALRAKFQSRIIAGERGAVEDLRNHDIAQRGQGDGPLAGGLSNTQAAANMAALEARYTPDQVAQIRAIGDEIVGAFAKLKEDAVKSGQISAEALREFPKFKHYVALTGPNQGTWDNQVSDAFGSFIQENRLREREGRTSSVAESSLEALAERVGRVAAYDASRDFKAELNNIYEKSGGENNTLGLQRFTANLVQTPTRSDIVWNSPEGKRYVFRFNEGASIGESLLGKNREYHETPGLKAMDFLTRKFSRAVTQWIIAFGPVNAIRDIQEKAVLIRSRDVKDANGNAIGANEVFKATWKYWLNPDTWRAAYQIAFSDAKRADESTQIGKYSNQLLTEGGVSTWGEQTRKGLANIEAAIKQESRRAGLARADLNSLQKVEDFVRNYNLMFEIMSSLSVNAAMRDLGVTAKDSAFQTLDLMNFQNVGARSGWMRAAFSFFNPGAQSGYNLYRQIIHSKRGRRDFFGLLAFSFFLQGLLRAAADDDDELGNELDQRGTWEVERNIPVNILGVPMKMPVGFGAPQFAWSIMNSGYRWLSGRYDTADAVAQAGISTLKSFNPIPISEIGPTKQPISFLLKTFTPTVFRPAVDFMTDSDAWGGKLTAYYPDKTKFRAEQGRPTTSGFYKDLAGGLKDIGMDLYPEQVKALGDSIAWGPFGYILQGVADWNKDNEGRRLNPMDKLPASGFLRFMGASRFVGGESRYLEARYYETYDKALNDLREFNQAKADGKEAAWRSENPEKSRRVANLQKQETTMRALSKEFNSTVRDLQNERLNIDRARPALERIQNKREAAMREFLKNLRVWQENEDDQP